MSDNPYDGPINECVVCLKHTLSYVEYTLRAGGAGRAYCCIACVRRLETLILADLSDGGSEIVSVWLYPNPKERSTKA